MATFKRHPYPYILWYWSVPRAGNRANDCLEEGCRVRSVASLGKAAGIIGLSMNGGRRPRAEASAQASLETSFGSESKSLPSVLLHAHVPPFAIKRSFAVDGTPFFGPWALKIVFEGFDSSCYPHWQHSAAGIVAPMSHRLN